MEWLWAILAVLVVGGLAYLAFRFLKNGLANTLLATSSVLLKGLSSAFKDKPGVDAHDVLVFVSAFLEKLNVWIKDDSNKEWPDLEDEVVAFIKESKDRIPGLKDASDEQLKVVAESLFKMAKAVENMFLDKK
jgi:hypothetical protein